jgi:hypothetical protein
VSGGVAINAVSTVEVLTVAVQSDKVRATVPMAPQAWVKYKEELGQDNLKHERFKTLPIILG